MTNRADVIAETPFAEIAAERAKQWGDEEKGLVRLNNIPRKADDLLAEMNAKHCLLLENGRIASLYAGEWVSQTTKDLNLIYCNQHVVDWEGRGGANLFKWWLRQPKRRQCRNMDTLMEEGKR
jgi:hypothetical protein